MMHLMLGFLLKMTQRSGVDERGQSTVEYALVIVGAAAVASLLIAWAMGSGAISNLFSSVIDGVLSKV